MTSPEPNAAPGQFILGDTRSGREDDAVRGSHGRHPRQFFPELAPDMAQGNAENSFAELEQIRYLARGGALEDVDTIAQQRHSGEVLRAVIAKVIDRSADLLQRNPSIE